MTTITTKHSSIPVAATGRRLIVLTLGALGVILLLLALLAGLSRLRSASDQPKALAVPAQAFANPQDSSVYAEQVPSAASVNPYVHGGSVYDQQIPQRENSLAQATGAGSVYNEQVPQ